jgi:hypothetical protein
MRMHGQSTNRQLLSAIRPFREAMRRRTRYARHSWQVFGLSGAHRVSVYLLAVASQSQRLAATSADDGGRS